MNDDKRFDELLDLVKDYVESHQEKNYQVMMQGLAKKFKDLPPYELVTIGWMAGAVTEVLAEKEILTHVKNTLIDHALTHVKGEKN